MTPPEPTLSLVVSTVGRPAELRRLVRSVEGGAAADRVELVVVDQSPDQSCLAMLAALDTPLRWIGTTSQRGASRGRNVGAGLARGELVAFPDDNCWYAADTVSRVLSAAAAAPAVAAVCGIQLTDRGAPSMLRWKSQPCAVTRGNVHRTAIESTIFMRRTVFELLAGFDESIGVGSAGPYQSGEATDLLLRGLGRGLAITYQPSIVVYQEDPGDDPTPAFVPKLAGYGAGFGLLYRRHGLPRTHLGYVLSRKLAAAAVRYARGERIRASADLAFARGVLRGYRGTPDR